MNTSTIQTLLNELRSGDPARQYPVLVELEKLRDPAAIPEILPWLSSPDEMVRWNSVEALGALDAAELEQVAPALLPMLDDPNESVRNATVEALMPLALPAAKEPIRTILRHDPYWVARASAAEALGYFEDEHLVNDLLQALDDEEPNVQSYAACSLGLIAPPTILPTLEHVRVMSSDLRVKGELIIAGYRLGALDSLRRLLKLIDQIDDEYVALTLINMLQHLTEWKAPAFLRRDAPQMRKAMLAFAQRFPQWGKDIEPLLNNLAELERSIEQGEPGTAAKEQA